jgi:hypothetical protein
VTETEQRAQATAERCQLLLDELLKPRSSAIKAEIQELRDAGVSASRIETLYPIALSDYARGIELLRNDYSLSGLVLTSPVLQDITNVRLRLSPQALSQLVSYDSDVVQQSADPSLLIAVDLVSLLRSTPLKELMVDPEGVLNPNDDTFLANWLEMLEAFLGELLRKQQVSNEWDPLKRMLLRLRQLPALLGLDGTSKRR